MAKEGLDQVYAHETAQLTTARGTVGMHYDAKVN